MTFTQDEHVVQAFASQTAEKTFAKGVGAGCLHCGFQQFDIRAVDHILKLLTKLLVVISNEKAWPLTKRRGFAQLLGDPGVCGVPGHVDIAPLVATPAR